MGSAGPSILLIENEQDDVFLFRRALSRVKYAGDVQVVVSVTQACMYLEGYGKFADREQYPLPDLIVSDMNLSGETGIGFLEWLRQEERFAHLPFVFLSGSFQPQDRTRSWELGLRMDEFFVKTDDMDTMTERVRSILKFLPPQKTGINRAKHGDE
jgi:CheY-like chemotaxis protein